MQKSAIARGCPAIARGCPAIARGCPAISRGCPAIARGFSLYELLMTMALAALVLTLGIPSFSGIVANHNLLPLAGGRS